MVTTDSGGSSNRWSEFVSPITRSSFYENNLRGFKGDTHRGFKEVDRASHSSHVLREKSDVVCKTTRSWAEYLAVLSLWRRSPNYLPCPRTRPTSILAT